MNIDKPIEPFEKKNVRAKRASWAGPKEVVGVKKHKHTGGEDRRGDIKEPAEMARPVAGAARKARHKRTPGRGANVGQNLNAGARRTEHEDR